MFLEWSEWCGYICIKSKLNQKMNRLHVGLNCLKDSLMYGVAQGTSGGKPWRWVGKESTGLWYPQMFFVDNSLSYFKWQRSWDETSSEGIFFSFISMQKTFLFVWAVSFRTKHPPPGYTRSMQNDFIWRSSTGVLMLRDFPSISKLAVLQTQMEKKQCCSQCVEWKHSPY